MKTLIVPVDFSDFSLKGMDLAILLARKYKASIEMVYVQKKTGEYYPSIKEKQLKWAEQKFKEIQQEYSVKLGKKTKIDFIIKHGKVHEEIVNQCMSHKDAVIVTSTHGISGFDAIFLGSNATKIIALSERMVYTINSENCPEDIKNIVLPIDYTKESRQKVPFVIELAKLFKSQVHVVTTVTKKDDDLHKKAALYSEQVCKALEKEKINVKTKLLVGKSIADSIIKYSESAKADLIAIMSEQSVSLANLLLGSEAELVLTKSSVPVLTIKPKELILHESFRTQGGA